MYKLRHATLKYMVIGVMMTRTRTGDSEEGMQFKVVHFRLPWCVPVHPLVVRNGKK